MQFTAALDAILTKDERKLLKLLNSPFKVQDYLDRLMPNRSKIGAIAQSPRWVIQNNKAHCIEGAVLAACVLAYNHQPGLLMDLRATKDDEDHVVCLFKVQGLWGAISKTKHPHLRWRDPVYKTPRELALSYFHEYFLFDVTHNAKRVSAKKRGAKTLREFSRSFDIAKFDPAAVWAAKNIDWLAEKLDDSPHLPLFPASAVRNLRKAGTLEIKAAKLEE